MSAESTEDSGRPDRLGASALSVVRGREGSSAVTVCCEVGSAAVWAFVPDLVSTTLVDFPMIFLITTDGVSSRFDRASWAKAIWILLNGPKSDTETCRVMLLEERLADGTIETDRRKTDKEGLGSGVDAENTAGCESGGRIW